MTTTRFCPGCRAEVEDTGGFCLLGHRLALDPPVASLKALREEVDKSFSGSELRAVAPSALDEAWDALAEPVMVGAQEAASAPDVEPVREAAPPPPPPSPASPTAAPALAPVAPAAPVAAAEAPVTPSPVVPMVAAATPAAPTTPVAPAAPTSPLGQTAPARRVPPPPPPVQTQSFVPAPARSAPPPPPPVEDRTYASSIPAAPSMQSNPAISGDEGGSDPIHAFAPAPRMDWGPAKRRLGRIGRLSRRQAAE